MNYSDLENFRRQRDEQRRLEEYMRTRVLPRPRTGKPLVAGLFLPVVLVPAATIVGLYFVEVADVYKAIAGVIVLCVFFELYLRFYLIKIVECYQHCAKEETRRKCLCFPSCSEYAIAVLKKYWLILALHKIRVRLFKTCRGDSYKIDYP